MILLAVDTSTHAGSVAVLENETILAEHFEYSRITHSERLMPEIDALLKSVNKTISDVDGFAVTSGPGSFTALRVGISTIQGLSLGGGKPVWGVGTLEAIAHQLALCSMEICPVVDARKGQIFAARFKAGPPGVQERLSEDVSVPPEEFCKTLEGPVVFSGNAIPAYRSTLLENAHPGSLFADPALWYSRASVVGLIAYSRFREGTITGAEDLKANYVRRSDAELSQK